MIVYSGSVDDLIVYHSDRGPLGKFARELWDTGSTRPNRGWSYNHFITLLSDALMPHGGQADHRKNAPGKPPLNIDVVFHAPEDYTLFCLRMG